MPHSQVTTRFDAHPDPSADDAVLAQVPVLLLTAALAAALGPAIRAARVDPVAALR